MLSWILVNGRETPNLYHFQIPSDWKVVHGEMGNDTKKPLVEFTIDQQVRVTVHNFPESGIPPEAQIVRWKGQFEKLNPDEVKIQPVAWSGYSGYAFEAKGLMKGKEVAVIAWALKLDPRHARVLLNSDKSADVTIKGVGPTEMINKNKRALELFAHSFELVETIPFDP